MAKSEEIIVMSWLWHGFWGSFWLNVAEYWLMMVKGLYVVMDDIKLTMVNHRVSFFLMWLNIGWWCLMAPDRWQATYTRIDAMEYRSKSAGPPPPPAEVLRGGPGSGGRSPVRKGYGSRPTSQTRKQAAVPPEAAVPGMQQGKRFRCTCQCITPNAPPRAPRRPNGRWRKKSLQCRPLPGWPAIDITERRGDACVHARQQKWKIWSEARTRRDRGQKAKKAKQLWEAWKLLWAGHIYAKVQHATMTRCNMATWLMHCSRYMEALRLGREEKMTRRPRRGQGSGVEGDAPGPKSQQAELSLRGRFRVACSKEDGFVCLCANIYSGYTGAWVFVLRVLCNIYNRQKMPEHASRAGMNADQRREIIPEPADPKCPGPQIFIADGEKKRVSLQHPSPLCLNRWNFGYYLFPLCLPWVALQKGFVPPKKNSLTGAD